eukprot:m.422737 g.422737  ORF g.422737 m.422737 type:complete len:58 (-) comp21329_c1_seq17:1081-1254(-)
MPRRCMHNLAPSANDVSIFSLHFVLRLRVARTTALASIKLSVFFCVDLSDSLRVAIT